MNLRYEKENVSRVYQNIIWIMDLHYKILFYT